MNSLPITADGQLTLTPDLLRHLGVAPGDRLRLEKRPDGQILLGPGPGAARAGDAPARDAIPALSPDEIEALAADGWARKG